MEGGRKRDLALFNLAIDSKLRGCDVVAVRVDDVAPSGYGCGLRAGEVVRLQVRHIDSAQSIIRVEQGKGRKDRHVMLSPETLSLLREWWAVRPTRYDAGVAAQERWVFPGRKPGRPLTTRQLNRLFHETAEAAGIKKAVTLATHLLERGTDTQAAPMSIASTDKVWDFAAQALERLWAIAQGSGTPSS